MTERAWRWLLMWMAIIIGAVAGVLNAQPRTYSLAIGRMSGGETTESHECYFPIGTGAVLMLHPEGEPCKVAREFVGSTGTLIWVRD